MKRVYDLPNNRRTFSTYWPRLKTDINGWVDWSLKIDSIERFICAFDEPYSGAKTFLGNKTVSLKSVSTHFFRRRVSRIPSRPNI